VKPITMTTRVALRQLDQGINQHYEPMFADYRLKPADVEILYLLIQRNGMLFTHMKEHLHLSQGFLSVRLRWLCEQGWITKKDARNTRTFTIWLTLKAVRISDRITESVQAGERWISDHLSEVLNVREVSQ